MFMKMNLAMVTAVALFISACSTTPSVTTEETPAASGQTATNVETSPMRSGEVTSTDLAAQLDQMQKHISYYVFM